MATLRYGILGTGNIARQFAEGCAKADRSSVVAVASREGVKADTFAKTFSVGQGDSIQAYNGYGALLNDPAVDAIYLSLPNALHHEWTIKALRAGKHVLCEKPIANDAKQAIEMYDVARETKRVLVEAFMYRAHPQTNAVVEAVRGGAIGKLKLIRTHFCFRVRNTAGNIRFDRSLAGGAMMDVGCYCVNFSNLLAGEGPESIGAVAVMHPSGVDEQTSVVMKYAGGITASFTVGMSVQSDNTAHLCGEDGYLTVGWPWKPVPPNSSYTIAGGVPPRQDNPAIKPVAPPPRTIVVPNDRNLFAIEADAFADVVLDGAPSFISERETIQNMRTLDAIRSQIGLSF